MSPQHFKQEKNQYGVLAAIERLATRRHLPLVGFVMLAIATGWSFSQERKHSNSNRQAIAGSTQTALYQGCLRNNQLRSVLVSILEQEYPQIKANVASGKLTVRDANMARRIVKDDIRKVSPVPCAPVTKVK